METANQSMNGETFATDFELLVPRIVDEFPAVTERALTRTRGNLDEVVALIAHETLHTRTFVRRRLQDVSRDALERDAETVVAHREAVESSRRRRNVAVGILVGLFSIVTLAVLSLVFAPRFPEPIRAPLLRTRARLPELGEAAKDHAVTLWDRLPEWGVAARDGASHLWDRRPWA